MTRPSVLIFSGSDPSGGAGMQADVQAVMALGAHPLSVITALTVQDNDRVFMVHPMPAAVVQQQAQALLDKIDIACVKIGIVGNRANAETIAETIRQLKKKNPNLHVVLDPVLASGHGDALSTENAVRAISPLIEVATLMTPNLPEAVALCGGDRRLDSQIETLLRVCPNVLIKGGHGTRCRESLVCAWRYAIVDLDAAGGCIPWHRLHIGVGDCLLACSGQADGGCYFTGARILSSDAAVVLCNRGWAAYSEPIAFIF